MVNAYFPTLGVDMSAWPRPTTADIAIRAFASTPQELMVEAALGMQDIIASSRGIISARNAIRQTGIWEIQHPKGETNDRILVKFLEEILYRCEVEDQWFVAGQVMLGESMLSVQASWVEESAVEREVEIKAVTRHELCFEQLSKGMSLPSSWSEVPEFLGPGWYCDVVFDI